MIGSRSSGTSSPSLPARNGATGVCRERLRAAAAPWKAAREPGMEEGCFPEPSKRCRDIVDRRPMDDS